MSDASRWSFGDPANRYLPWMTYYGFFLLERADTRAGYDRYGDRFWFTPVAEHLLAGQRADGRWAGFGHDIAIQCFALLALSHARPRSTVSETPSSSLGEAHFAAARRLGDAEFTVFVGRVLDLWSDASEAGRDRLAAGLASIGARALRPLVEQLDVETARISAASALDRVVAGDATPSPPRSVPARITLRREWTEWIRERSERLRFDAEREVLTPFDPDVPDDR
jgi:hypothetical protein